MKRVTSPIVLEEDEVTEEEESKDPILPQEETDSDGVDGDENDEDY